MLFIIIIINQTNINIRTDICRKLVFSMIYILINFIIKDFIFYLLFKNHNLYQSIEIKTLTYFFLFF